MHAGFSLVVESGGFSLLCGHLTVVVSLTAEQGSGRRGLSSCCTWAEQLWLPGLEGRLSNCRAHVQLAHGNLPRLGIKPMSPVLAGGFFTTEPPGKPYFWLSNRQIWASQLPTGSGFLH